MKRQNLTKSNPNNIYQIKTLHQSLTDSVHKFNFLDEYTLREDSGAFVIHGGRVNGRKIAFIAITDSCLFFFQTINKNLQQTDSIRFETYAHSFAITDLNGDYLDDYIIYSFPDIHGQSIPFVFLSNKDSILHYRNDIHLSNIRYNMRNKTVESYYESCAYCEHSKSVYKWVGDSLVLLKRAVLDLTNPRYITTQVYELQRGKEIQTLNVRGENNIYDTVLFEIY